MPDVPENVPVVAPAVVPNVLNVSSDDEPPRDERRICKVCKINEATRIPYPCGHAHFCERCITHPTVKTCPICREDIERISMFF